MNSEEQRAHGDLKYEQGLTALTQPDPFFISAYGPFVAKPSPTPAWHWIWGRPGETCLMAGQQQLAGHCRGPLQTSDWKAK
jgi:hypothetical protein